MAQSNKTNPNDAEELEALIEYSRIMARTRKRIMNPEVRLSFEEAVELALGILIRRVQREIEEGEHHRGRV
jgi:hypothetical protein